MKKVSLKNKGFVITMIALLLVVNSANAEDFNGDLSYEEGAEVYVESVEEAELKERKEAELRQRPSVYTQSENAVINVQAFLQQRNYYCGPATVKQVVHYVNGSSETQAYYANQLGTTNAGTDMTRIAGVINAAIGENYYVYDQIDSEDEWIRELELSIYYERPAILDINTTGISAFPYTTEGHFVNLSGFDYSPLDGVPDQFRITDCAAAGYGNHWYDKADLYQANMQHFRQAYIW